MPLSGPFLKPPGSPPQSQGSDCTVASPEEAGKEISSGRNSKTYKQIFLALEAKKILSQG